MDNEQLEEFRKDQCNIFSEHTMMGEYLRKSKPDIHANWIIYGDQGIGFDEFVLCRCSYCDHKKKFVGSYSVKTDHIEIDKKWMDKFCPNCGAQIDDAIRI